MSKNHLKLSITLEKEAAGTLPILLQLLWGLGIRDCVVSPGASAPIAAPVDAKVVVPVAPTKDVAAVDVEPNRTHRKPVPADLPLTGPNPYFGPFRTVVFMILALLEQARSRDVQAVLDSLRLQGHTKMDISRLKKAGYVEAISGGGYDVYKLTTKGLRTWDELRPTCTLPPQETLQACVRKTYDAEFARRVWGLHRQD